VAQILQLLSKFVNTRGVSFQSRPRTLAQSLPVTLLYYVRTLWRRFWGFCGFPVELPVPLKWREEMEKEERIKKRHSKIWIITWAHTFAFPRSFLILFIPCIVIAFPTGLLHYSPGFLLSSTLPCWISFFFSNRLTTALNVT